MAGVFVPVSPARVEIIITAPVESMWSGAVMGNGLYGRQTLRGNLAYGGGPHEWVDVENRTPMKPNSPVVRNLARRLAELFAGASDVPLLRSWACVVEQTPDMLPIIDFPETPRELHGGDNLGARLRPVAGDGQGHQRHGHAR